MSAYLLTVNPAKWTDPGQREFVESQVDRFRAGEPLDPSSWLSARKTYEVGDRVYLLLQGAGPRGIIASGHVADERLDEESHFEGDGRRASYVRVAWDAFIEDSEALPTSTLEDLAPSTSWGPRSSGTQVSAEDEEQVETAWLQLLDVLELTALTGAPTANRREVAAEYYKAERKVRRHQRAFRQLLLSHYAHECAYCGVNRIELLEAAHLKPDSLGGASSTDNGRLLCANHHRALDSGLLHWDAKSTLFVLPAGHEPIPPLPPD